VSIIEDAIIGLHSSGLSQPFSEDGRTMRSILTEQKSLHTRRLVLFQTMYVGYDPWPFSCFNRSRAYSRILSSSELGINQFDQPHRRPGEIPVCPGFNK